MRIRNVLFLCSRNRLRSPTAEQIVSDRTDIEVASAGLDHDAATVCTPELLQWADLVFVMETRHRTRLSKRFKQHLKDVRVICLDIPDVHEFMQPELVTLLQARVARHLPRR